jgi:HAD superfamily phosphoserine phosphatase-like hydrolase
MFTTPDHLAMMIAADLGRHFSHPEETAIEEYGLFVEPPDEWVSPVRDNPWRYKVAAFDLDGTLLRGPDFEFSWERVWKDLGFGKAIQRELKCEYRRRSGSGIDRNERIRAYTEWCVAACENFKGRGLSRDQLRDMCRELHLTANCREGLAQLRSEGVIVAIVSGGVNTFLEDLFPDYRDYVDFVFINELLFSDAGLLEGVRASAYDFQGKAEALDLVCQRGGCTPAETVFVGDHYNDEAIMLRVNKAIAYPPMDFIARDAASVAIREDDLLEVIPHILVD